MLLKNKNSSDFTEAARSTYNIIKSKFGYTARITNIWELLQSSLGIEEFEILDTRFYNNVEFNSYLIDQQIEWLAGKDLDFGDIVEAILTVGEFTQEEKRLLKDSRTEEILWGIFLAICNHDLVI